jgi:hypothetical protein
MPRSPAKSLTSTVASPPDTSLDPPCDAEEVRSWRNGAWTPLLTGLASRPVTAAQPPDQLVVGRGVFGGSRGPAMPGGQINRFVQINGG